MSGGNCHDKKLMRTQHRGVCRQWKVTKACRSPLRPVRDALTRSGRAPRRTGAHKPDARGSSQRQRPRVSLQSESVAKGPHTRKASGSHGVSELRQTLQKGMLPGLQKRLQKGGGRGGQPNPDRNEEGLSLRSPTRPFQMCLTSEPEGPCQRHRCRSSPAGCGPGVGGAAFRQ